MPKYIVETISMFKLSYLVEAENAEYARDIVTCNVDGQEVIQEHLEEVIIGTKKIKSEKKYNKFVKKTNYGEYIDDLILTQDGYNNEEHGDDDVLSSCKTNW